MIAGVVLAAGRSLRMGAPKALLTLGGQSFLERIVRGLREGGCDLVVVVTGPPADEDARAIMEGALALGALAAVNPDRTSEQVESLRIGLEVVPASVACACVTPVDVPGVRPEVVRALIGAVAGGALIAVPTHGGRRGHPLALAAELFPEIVRGDLPEGARTVLRRHADRLVEIDAGARDVLLDIDTPADYARLLESTG